MTNPLRLIWTLVALASLGAAGSAQDAPRVEVRLDAKSAKPSAEVKGTVVITFAPGLHGYQNPPSKDYQMPVVVKAGAGTTIVRVKYPAGHEEEVGGETAKVYSGRTEVPVTFKAPSKPGKATFSAIVEYQQCNASNCFAPDKVTSSVALDIVAAEEGPVVVRVPPKPDPQPEPNIEPPKQTPKPVDPPIEPKQTEPKPVEPVVAVPEATEPPAVAATSPAPADEGGLAGLLQRSFRSKSYLVLFGLLLLIGLAVNLTPCVYPLIPVTLSFFAGQSGGSKSARLKLGLMYMFGIAATYGITGGLAAAAGASFGALFTQTWFLVFLGALMIVLALSMFDLYQLTLPPVITKHLKGRSGPVGALIMGLLVGVAAAPCAGPLIAAVFAEAAKLRDTTLAVLMFTTVGLGIGIPYVILGSAASGAKALPKAGGWMKTVKAILGLIVIGVGLSYLMQAFERHLVGGVGTLVWVAFYVGSAVFLFAVDKETPTRAVVGLKGAAILTFGLLGGMAWQEHSHALAAAELQRLGGGSVAIRVNWQPFSVEAFEVAKRSGKVIVVDGSANWCAACKEIERNVFDKPEGIIAMRDVIALRIDWSTGVDPKYVETTEKMFDITGLPHVVFHRPGGERSEIKTHLANPAELIDALKRAGAKL